VSRSRKPRVRSFPPLIGTHPRVLILGSMPGTASLAAHRYYAHPRNLFWPILAELLGFDAQAEYDTRCAALVAHGDAVWDVLAECHRPGSLDSAIDRSTEHPNDLATLLATHPHIGTILLNGAKAASSYRRHHPQLEITTIALPSTSPANASIPLAIKRERWREALRAAGIAVVASG
jgi:double-stranded uracil-DNA glycosylase